MANKKSTHRIHSYEGYQDDKFFIRNTQIVSYYVTKNYEDQLYMNQLRIPYTAILPVTLSNNIPNFIRHIAYSRHENIGEKTVFGVPYELPIAKEMRKEADELYCDPNKSIQAYIEKFDKMFKLCHFKKNEVPYTDFTEASGIRIGNKATAADKSIIYFIWCPKPGEFCCVHTTIRLMRNFHPKYNNIYTLVLLLWWLSKIDLMGDGLTYMDAHRSHNNLQKLWNEAYRIPNTPHKYDLEEALEHVQRQIQNKYARIRKKQQGNPNKNARRPKPTEYDKPSKKEEQEEAEIKPILTTSLPSYENEQAEKKLACPLCTESQYSVTACDIDGTKVHVTMLCPKCGCTWKAHYDFTSSEIDQLPIERL